MLDRKVFYTLVKAAIACLSLFFILYKVFARPDPDLLLLNLGKTLFRSENIFPLILLVLLMLLNWSLETFKWMLLVNKLRPVSWILCLRSVLSGVTVSFFTPNRVGEFAGRIMHLDQGMRIKGAIACVIGSMNQLLVTLVAGACALLFSVDKLIDADSGTKIFVSALTILIMVLAIYFYFRLPDVNHLVKKISPFRKVTIYTRVFELYNSTDLSKLSAYSMFRYLVFSSQFILALYLFDIRLPLTDAYRYIALIYLVMAFIPAIALGEISVRGSVALYFLTPAAGNGAGVLAATSFVWLLNLVIPALIGALTIFYFRLNR